LDSGVKIFCKTLLQGDSWQKDVELTLTADGIISGIATGNPDSADHYIQGIVIPGMPNAHSHSFQRLIAGLTGPQGNQKDSFWSWREAMYRCANQISPDQFGVVASHVFSEMLKAGYTSCAEFHYLHHQPDGKAYANPAEMSAQLIQAASVTGMPMTLLPVLYCSAGFGEDSVSVEQRRFSNSSDSFLGLLGNIQGLISGNPLLALGLAPHSLRAVPGSVLQEVLTSWPDQRCPVHIHIAEQPAEISECVKHLGARPIEWLLDNFQVDERWNLVHATHMSDSELSNAASCAATVVVCPTTEADLGDGRFRTSDWLQAGGRLTIGSDSNVRISVAEELRLLEYNERLNSGQRNVLTTGDSTCGRFLYQHAAQSGATALGQAVGVLQPGFRADFLVLDQQHELIIGRQPDVALDTWIFAGDRNMLDSVWVAGQCVVQHGIHYADSATKTAFMQTIKELQI
jgi:formimidoylglutamate deiminase